MLGTDVRPAAAGANPASAQPLATPDTNAVERVQERLLLHEILRVGLARQEDLSLLQQISQTPIGLTQEALTQAFKECQYREEWRCMREAQLLASIARMNLSSVTDANMALLAQQVDKVKQMQVQQRQTRIEARPQVGAASTRTVQRSQSLQSSAQRSPGALEGVPPPPASSLGAALSLYAAAPRSPAARPKASNTHTDASRPSPGRTSAGALHRSTSRTTPPTLLTPQELRRQLSLTQHTHAHSPTAARHSTTLSTPTHTTTTLSSRASAPALGSPTTPPHSQAVQSSSGRERDQSSAAAALQRPGTSTAPSAEPRPPVTRTISVPTTPQRSQPAAPAPAAGPPAGGAGSEVPRFQRILKLQSTLLSGLHQHAESGGPQAAVAALEENVALMQLHFQECATAAKQLHPHTRDQEPPSPGNIRQLHNWSRLLPLAQLGLTSQDMVRLHRIRQSIAARAIQRSVRQYLRRVRHTRALADAAQRAADAAARLRHHAARVIQRYWRGHRARIQCVALRAARHEARRQAVLERARRSCAATRIQRAWRMYRKRRRAQKASVASTIACYAGTLCCSANLDLVQANKAATTIQAAVRGWLWRRSNTFWWKRSVRDIRDRRTGKRAWDNERSLLASIQPLQRQLLASVRHEASERERILSVVRQEEESFEAAWLRWLAMQHAQALQQPLPKGWVPHRDPATGAELFVDTKTGAMHAYHPAVLELRAFAAAERERAIAQLQQRTAAAASRLEALQAAGAAERAEITARIQAVVDGHRARVGAV